MRAFIVSRSALHSSSICIIVGLAGVAGSVVIIDGIVASRAVAAFNASLALFWDRLTSAKIAAVSAGQLPGAAHFEDEQQLDLTPPQLPLFFLI